MWSKELQDRMWNEIIPSLEKELFQVNDHIARNPEIGSAEFETSALLVKTLRSHGVEVEYPFGGLPTAFRAILHPEGKKKAAWLAEYDALPGIGHGCGHCASGTASLLAFLAVKEVEEAFPDVRIDLIGTPDEEWGGGKVLLQKQGIFDDYDFAAMVHMNGKNQAKVDFYALDGMEFRFHGHPAHAAASPEKGRNALNAVRLLFDSTDMMRQHVIKEAILSGYIKEGGKASNIVPDYACANFVTRAPKRSQLDDITAWVKDCARAAALATRTTVEILPDGVDYDGYSVGPKKEKLMEECFRALGLSVSPADGGCGSSDIGNVSSVCLTFHPMMSIGQDLEPHTHEFAAAMTDERTHRAISNAGKYLLELTRRLFSDEALLAQLKEEHFRNN